MKRKENLVGAILFAFVLSVGLVGYEKLTQPEMKLMESWKAPIHQSYAYYLKGMLKHLQLDLKTSANDQVMNVELESRNLPS